MIGDGSADLVSSLVELQLLNKDFYHLSATTFEFKDTAPNGVAFKVTGKSSHEKATSAAVSLPACPSRARRRHDACAAMRRASPWIAC